MYEFILVITYLSPKLYLAPFLRYIALKKRKLIANGVLHDIDFNDEILFDIYFEIHKKRPRLFEFNLEYRQAIDKVMPR